jgi:hypothetical protein
MEQIDKAPMSIPEKLLAQEEYWLAGYHSGHYVPDSNVDRCLREGLRSIRRAVITAGLEMSEAQEAQRRAAIDFVDYLQALFENLTGLVDIDMYKNQTNDPLWQECLWVIPNLENCFKHKGYTDAEPYNGDVFGLKGFPSRKYLETHTIWQSNSLERILIHHLIVWETMQFGPVAITNQISIWDEFAQTVIPKKFKHSKTSAFLAATGHKEVTADSIASLNALRGKTAIVRVAIYFLSLLVIAVLSGLSTSDIEIVRQLSVWVVVPLSISLSLWTIGSIFGWIIHPLLFRKSINKQLQPLVLLANMSRLADRFLMVTSPKEAEFDMLKVKAEGAVLPNDCWALLYLSINRGDAFWGGELQSRPFYKTQTEEPLADSKPKQDGLRNLSKILSGWGTVDKDGAYQNIP